MTLTQIKKLLSAHKNELKRDFYVQAIGIFGSYARGKQQQKSDLDILLEFERPISFLKLVSVENYLTDLLGVKVDVVPKEDIRIELRDTILSEAIYV